VALAGAGWLVMLAWLHLTGGSVVAPLALIASAPGWVLGIIAAVELGAIARGRQVRTRRALAWGALVLGGGVVAASLGGQLTLLATLLTQPQGVGLDWSAVYLDTAEGGVYNYYKNSGEFWLPVLAIVLGALVVVAVLRDMRRRVEARPTNPILLLKYHAHD